MFKSMYERLVGFMIDNLDLQKTNTVLEAGCGAGQLTLPFVKKLAQISEGFRYVAYDAFGGPYEDDLKDFSRMVREEGLQKLVTVIQGKVESMEMMEDESIDLIVSNELFPDLNRNSLGKTLREFHRILKPNGQMAHGELNPIPENESQALLIEANAYSSETKQPPEWFSPCSDEVSALMHKSGFKNIMVKYFETEVRMNYVEAMKQLRKWKIDPVFIDRRGDDIKRLGLEFPIEHVIFCSK
jgi:ubiquinone/menaquinone biosynthesis C-methylase UbiE